MGFRNENQRRQPSGGGRRMNGAVGAAGSGALSAADGGRKAAPIISFLNGQCAPCCSQEEMLRGLFSLGGPAGRATSR